MYPHQTERLTEALEREGLEALIATTPENLFYVTGLHSPVHTTYRGVELYGIFTRGGTALVVPAIDAVTAAAEVVDVAHVRSYGRLYFATSEPPDATTRRIQEWTRDPSASAVEALGVALATLGVDRGRVGIDEGGLSPIAWRRAVEHLGQLAIVEAGDIFGTARQIKGPWELECLKRALSIAEESVNVVIQGLKPGISEREAASLFSQEVIKREAEPSAVVLLFGERSAFPAVDPSDRALKMGELVRFDLGCAYKGYRSQVARTAVMGEPSARQQEIHDAIQGGLESALEAIKPGVTAGTIFDRAVNGVRAAGLGGYERAQIGHGIGLEPYERPKLVGGSQAQLEMGMVLRVETPYYELGWGGLHVKDTVLVTDRGHLGMNRSMRGLVILD